MSDSRNSFCSQNTSNIANDFHLRRDVHQSNDPLRPETSSPNFLCPRNSVSRIDNDYVLIQFGKFLQASTEKSGLLALTSLNTQIVCPKILMNLCCCFGNVRKLIVDPVQGSALVQFDSYSEALEAEARLNRKLFFGLILNPRVLDSYYLRFSRRTAALMTHLQPLRGHFTFYRYQYSLNIRYNPPTTTLHLTNIADGCDQVILFTLLSQIREPIRIIRLVQRGKGESQMYLAEF
jgi:hypothetical protein